MLAWRTEGDAAVQHGGVVRFIGNDDGTTTVDVKLAYNPPGGVPGHVVARLLGADPRHQMDDDLLRMKTFLETGRAPRYAARHARGEQHAPPAHEEPPARTH